MSTNSGFISGFAKKKVLRIGLGLPLEWAFGREILRGVRDYARPAQPWALHMNVSDLVNGGFDGIICAASDPAYNAKLLKLGVPVVNISSTETPHDFVTVRSHDHAIGVMAAKHLVDCGFQHFGFFGKKGRGYSMPRQAGFEEELRSNGYSTAVFDNPYWFAPFGKDGISAEFREWLRGLPKPCGIFAANDREAFHVAEECRYTEIRVPDEVGIVGVDNEEFVCDLAWPPLSSVKPNFRQAGVLAAELLDELMAGKARPSKPILIPPLHVVKRASTDVFALPDGEVADALRFIRDHASEPMDVGDILKAVPISRRSLEQRMRRAINRSPQEQIQHVHVERAKEFLADTDWPMPRVALACGFSGPSVFSRVFQRVVGQSPRDYRAKHRNFVT